MSSAAWCGAYKPWADDQQSIAHRLEVLARKGDVGGMVSLGLKGDLVALAQDLDLPDDGTKKELAERIVDALA